MKITIDTKEDSHQEIKRVIMLLKHMVGEDGNFYSNKPLNQPDMFADDAPAQEEKVETKSETSDGEAAAGLFSMFGDNDSGAKQEASDEGTSEVVEAKEEDSDAEVVPYD
ncbi:MAG: hypothetical protein QGH47_02980 [Candidatus Woesearchaeota archaeon]|jgi:hypothetical protein|nr:hypothetical protein [Candidatus Woesearchaeota archaeon]